MNTFMFALNAIMPIILLILLGYILKKKGFLDEGWFKKGNKFVFRVCLPVLLFVNVYNIESFADIDWQVILYSEFAIMVVFLLGLVLVQYTVSDERQKGVILQCVFRSNYAIIGIPLAESLGGAEGVAVAAILSAFSIPTFNILAVISLNMYIKRENGGGIQFANTLKKIATNPLIIGVVCGLVVLAIRAVLSKNSDNVPLFSLSDDMPFIYSAFSNLAKISSPLALIILGGLFDFSAIKELKKQIFIGTVARVVVVPCLVLGVAIILSKYVNIINIDNTAFPALIALSGSPVAVSSAIMAQEMENDGVLAGQLVVWTSVMSIFTLFIIIAILRGLGVL